LQDTIATEILRKLHRIHQQLGDLSIREQRGPRVAQAHADNIAKLEAQLAEFQGKVKTLRVSVDDKQMQLKSRAGGVDKRKLQLQEAKSNKEYQALKEQIAADEAANDVLETEVLEVMERFDEASRQAAEAQTALKKAREEARRSQEEFDRQTPLIQTDVTRLTDELHQVEKLLPAEFRETYARMVRQKGSEALAPILGEFCGGCNHQVPVNLITAVMLNHPVYCRSCGRMLYLPEGAGLKE
jgi:hypothetical protein